MEAATQIKERKIMERKIIKDLIQTERHFEKRITRQEIRIRVEIGVGRKKLWQKFCLFIIKYRYMHTLMKKEYTGVVLNDIII